MNVFTCSPFGVSIVRYPPFVAIAVKVKLIKNNDESMAKL